MTSHDHDVPAGRDPQLVAAGQGYEPVFEQPGRNGALPALQLMYEPASGLWFGVFVGASGEVSGKRWPVTVAIEKIIEAERAKWDAE